MYLQLAILISVQDPLALRRTIADALLVNNVAHARYWCKDISKKLSS
jgi:hypothetical protein